MSVDSVIRRIEEDRAHLLRFFLIQEITSALLQLFLYLVVDTLQYGDVLLGSADHTVIERLGVNRGSHRVFDIAGFVENDVAVAGTLRRWPAFRRISRRTMPSPPVARIISHSFMAAPPTSREGSSIHPIISSGAPAATAASSIILAASHVHFFALGCGEMRIAFLVLSASRIL